MIIWDWDLSRKESGIQPSCVRVFDVGLTLLMKLDFPTLGNPQIMIVLVLGSMEGKRLKCCLTCSK